MLCFILFCSIVYITDLHQGHVYFVYHWILSTGMVPTYAVYVVNIYWLKELNIE